MKFGEVGLGDVGEEHVLIRAGQTEVFCYRGIQQ
jgi:hypothetical protein